MIIKDHKTYLKMKKETDGIEWACSMLDGSGAGGMYTGTTKRERETLDTAKEYEYKIECCPEEDDVLDYCTYSTNY